MSQERDILFARMNPQPVSFELISDGICRLDDAAKIVIATPEEIRSPASVIRKFWNCSPEIRFEKAASCSNVSGAYDITVDENGICITAPDNNGVLNALKTLRQLAEEERGVLKFQAYELPFCRISDAPAISFRGLHICWFPENHSYQIERAIRLAAYCKYNYVVLETWGVFPFEKAPFLCWQDKALDKNELKRIIAEANELGLTVIPQFNILGHASGSRENGGKHVTLNRFPEYASLFEPDGWSFCLSNPETRRILKDCVLEMYETFGKPGFFHIGSDEARLLATCRTCRRIPRKDLVKDHFLFFHDLMAQQDARIMMWHDMLLDKEDPRWNGYIVCGSVKDGLTDLYKELPKDIFICDWQYGYPKGENDTPPTWATSRFFKENGFDVIVSPASNLDGLRSLAELTATAPLAGILETTWADLDTAMFTTIYKGSAAIWHGGDSSKLNDAYIRPWAPDDMCLMHHLLRQVENDMALRDYYAAGRIMLQVPEKIHL